MLTIAYLVKKFTSENPPDRTRKPPVSAFVRSAFDLGLDGELDAMFDCRLFNIDENEVQKLLRHPNAAVALSDAGAHVQFGADFGYGTILLGL